MCPKKRKKRCMVNNLGQEEPIETATLKLREHMPHILLDKAQHNNSVKDGVSAKCLEIF